MKKKLFSVLISFLTLIGLASCKSTTTTLSDYFLDLEINTEEFKVLQLTDLHIGNKDNRKRQYKFLDSIYEDSKANDVNLVVVSGDLFTFADKRTAKELFSYLDSKHIPWTCTFGNHDEQCYFSIEWLTGYLNKLNNSKDSYCIFKDIHGDDLTGNANFVINVKKDTKIIQQVYIIDSNRYHFGVEGSTYMYYDYIHEDQVNWYKECVEYSTTTLGNGSIIPSEMFYHIEIPEYAEVYQYDEQTQTVTLNPEAISIFNTVGIREKICCPEYNSGLFDAILEGNSTKVMSVGHDHKNDACALYKGVYFAYGVTSTDRVYYEDGIIGATTIKYTKTNTYEFDHIIKSYED